MIVLDEQLSTLATMLAPLAAVHRVPASSINNQLLVHAKATALFVRSVTKVNTELLANTNVQFVGSATAGTDHINIRELAELNVRFASAEGCNANAVAEYVMDTLEAFHVPTSATIGIIGLGNVGGCVARYSIKRGMRVLVNDPPRKARNAPFPQWAEYVDVDTLLRTCSVVTVHVPLELHGEHATHNLVHADAIASLGRGSLLINTARGGVVNEDALLERVVRGDVKAALDVFTNEPFPSASLVKAVHQATPHIAGYSEQAKHNAARMMYEAYTGLAYTNVLPVQSTTTGLPIYDRDLICSQFEELRSSTPLRNERTQPPSWEECDVFNP